MKPPTQSKEKKPVQKPKMVKTSLRFPEDLWKAARIRAIELDMDAQDLIADALRQYLEQKGGAR